MRRISNATAIARAMLACSALVITAPHLSAQPVNAPRASAPRVSKQLRVQETSLGARPADTIPGTFTFSSALDVAYIQKVTRGERVVVNGIAGRVFTSIPRVRLTEAGPVKPISFSPNGKRVAYVATLNNKLVMVVDGVAGAPFDYIAVGSAKFSPDSRRVTYIAKRGDKQFVITDGRESAPYDGIDVRHATFTADSKHVVYTATVGTHHVVVFDDKEVGSAEYVGDPVLSKNGDRMAYVVMRNDAWSVVVDGVEGKAYRGIGNNLIFSQDAKHFLYRGRSELDHIVFDGMESAGFGSIRENSYNMSRNGLHVAFVAQDRGRDSWVLDGVAQKTYDWVSDEPTFSPDGRKLAYVAELERKRFVVIGAGEGERFDDITSFPKFSADNRVLYVAKRGAQQFVVVDTVATAYDEVSDAFITPAGQVVIVARRGSQWSVFIDGKQGAAYDQAPNSFITSDDGKLLVFAGSRNGKRFVRINDKESASYDDVRALTISPDGNHVAFIATRGRRELVVLDGAESATYDQVLWLESHGTPDTSSFGFLARRGNVDLRVMIAWNAVRR